MDACLLKLMGLYIALLKGKNVASPMERGGKAIKAHYP
jgi:hypothetical protein